MPEPFRLEPALPVTSYVTYNISQPQRTHWRPATCAEMGCGHHVNGWETRVDESTDLGQKQAHYIRHDRGRRHVETRDEAGITHFAFEAGQTCFNPHQTTVGKPELYLVRSGDWRGSPEGVLRRHQNVEQFIDDFGEHQETLADRLKKG
jgi:hypothetical protein